jgi:hypothetical protein
VVRILPRKHPNVDRRAGSLGERPDEFLCEARVERADLLRLGVHAVREVRPRGDVERDLDERLVERHERLAEPGDPRLVAERFRHGLPDRDPRVLNGVVCVDVQIALRLDGEVEPGVLPELFQHVIEERDPGLRARRPRAVDDEVDRDDDFLRSSRHRGVAPRFDRLPLRNGGGDRRRHDEIGLSFLLRRHPP